MASNAANGQETTLHSRCAQQSATCVYLALPILKVPRSCIYVFDISKSTVAEEIYHVVHILFTNYNRYIKWYSIRQWNQFLDTFPSFPNAVGMIDGTIHRIRRPSGPIQAEFYRGDKRCHFISSQIVVDADGLIVLLVTGYSISPSSTYLEQFCFCQIGDLSPPFLYLSGFQGT